MSNYVRVQTTERWILLAPALALCHRANSVRGSRRSVVVLVLVAGALATTAAGAPAVGWLAPAGTLPGPVEVDSQDMGLDAQGNAVAVWTSYGTWRRTQAATRPVGGPWSAPITFSVPDEKSGWNPRVAVGANGDAVAVWSSTRLDTDRQITMAATREAGGGWSAPVELSLHGDGDIGISYQPAVVVDAQGTATAIWSEDTDDGEAILTRSRPKGGGWSAPVEPTSRPASRSWRSTRRAM
jgi:hypothetical protein